MRCLALTAHGPPEVLTIQWRRESSPGPGEVQIAVRAAGVGFSDVLARVGLHPDAPGPPWGLLGCEVAGEIEAVGVNVDEFSRGQSVMALCAFGAYAELIIAPAQSVWPLPDGWTFEEGAALPLSYATAYAALVRYGGLQPKERVLVHGAGGGVGVAATQIARLHGAEVFGAASAWKHDAIKGLGANHTIDYRTGNLVDQVRRIAGEEYPLDLVLARTDARTWRESYSLLRPGGRLVCLGPADLVSQLRWDTRATLRSLAETSRFSPRRLAHDSKAVIGLHLLRLWQTNPVLDEYLEPLSEWIAQGTIRPVVAKTFPLEQGSEAHRFLEDRMNIGKVVLTM